MTRYVVEIPVLLLVEEDSPSAARSTAVAMLTHEFAERSYSGAVMDAEIKGGAIIKTRLAAG